MEKISSSFAPTNFKNLKDVIKIINDLRDCGVEKLIALPKIVVIGVQSSGKSSLLEQIVQFEFLPKGTGVVTRCPIEIRLIHTEKLDEPYVYFFEEKDKTYKDFAQVRQKILDITDSKAGKKDIIEEPIVLTIFQQNCPTLTLIDLPGMTLNSTDGQSENVSERTLQITNSYISEAKTIILCVIPINNDLETSLALQIAKKADKNGDRTIGVLTMIDCMKNGTDCSNVLSNSVIPLKHRYYGVKLGNHNEKVSVEQAIKNEKEFFKKNEPYKPYSQYTGTDQLTKKLSSLLESQIQQYLPVIYKDIETAIEKQTQEKEKLGNPVPTNESKKYNFFNKLIERTVKSFKILLKSTDSEVENNDYPESLIINDHFGNHYFNHILDGFIQSCQSLKKQTLDNFTLQQVHTDLRKYRLPVSGFLPFKAFEENMKNCIKRFEDLSNQLLQEVLTYIQKLYAFSLDQQIYPNIQVKQAIYSVGSNMIASLCRKAQTLLKQNFIVFKDSIYSRSHNIITLESDLKTITVNVSHYGEKKLYDLLVRDKNFLKQNITNFVLNATTIKQNGVINSDQCVADNTLKANELGERDDIVRYCLTFHQYLENFTNFLGDLVPQIIQSMMIKCSKKEIQSALLSQLLNPRKIDLNELLREDVAVTEERKIIKKYLASLEDGKFKLQSVLSKDSGIFLMRNSKKSADDIFSFEEIKGDDDDDEEDEHTHPHGGSGSGVAAVDDDEEGEDDVTSD